MEGCYHKNKGLIGLFSEIGKVVGHNKEWYVQTDRGVG